MTDLPKYENAETAACMLAALLTEMGEHDEVSMHLLSVAKAEALHLEADDAGPNGGRVTALLQALWDRMESRENQQMAEDAARQLLASLNVEEREASVARADPREDRHG